MGFKQPVVVWPECALGTGCFGCLGRFLGVGVDAVKGEMPEGKLYIVAVSVYQTLKDGKNPAAARSLEVAIFDDGDEWLTGALRPIVGAYSAGISE